MYKNTVLTALVVALALSLLVIACESEQTVQSPGHQGQALNKGLGVTGFIGDRVWSDLNCDGIQDEGEPGIVGVVITLRSGSCPGGDIVATTTTGDGGYYEFTGVGFGDYCVLAKLPEGCTESTPNPAPVKLDVGHPDTKDIDFGFCCPPPPKTCGRMTGGGSVFTVQNARVTRGFEIHCDLTPPNNLEVNWPGGNNFHMNTLTNAVCTDDPLIIQFPPAAPFDTFTADGVGKLNNVEGATIHFVFVDAGEPGKYDTALIIIKDAGGNVVLTVSGYLKNGNLQAHDDNCD